MSVVLQSRPRAYVAAPVAPANRLFQVIHWAFDLAEDLTWGDLGILVAEPTVVEQLGQAPGSGVAILRTGIRR